MYKEAFETYLKEVRGCKHSTVKHYFEAIRWISNYLINKNLIDCTLFEIRDYDELIRLKEILLMDPDFVSMDKIGHQMYTAGLNNYCRFAEGADLAVKSENLMLFDTPRLREEDTLVTSSKPARNPINKRQVIRWSGYTCCISENHKTFTNYSNMLPYMEGHHIIPLSMQKEFENSLDVYANIACMCPLCHRKIHYAVNDERVPMIKKLYDERHKRLETCGITVSKDDFVDMLVQGR